MAKPTKSPHRAGRDGSPSQAAESAARRVAEELGYELVETVFQKEPRGKCLCFYVDCEAGITLSDCERFHRAVQPLLESVDYDFLEVSSPGIDRPIRTRRDFERHRGERVSVRLYAPLDGRKTYEGALTDFTDTEIVLDEAGRTFSIPREKAALVRPLLALDDLDGMTEDEFEALLSGGAGENAAEPDPGTRDTSSATGGSEQ